MIAGSVPMGPDRSGEVTSSITRVLVEDHRRLERLLKAAVDSDGHVEREAYDRFRSGLLRHIGMEEKILLPTAQRRRGGAPLAIAAQLRLEHGAIAALLMPTPTSSVLAMLHMILEQHNLREEGPEGLYQMCDLLVGDELNQLVVKLQTASEVGVLPCSDAPAVLSAVRRAVERAGFAPSSHFPA